MAKYDIDPAGVQKVLTATGKDAEQFETLLKPVGDGAEALGTACGGSVPVCGALTGLFNQENTRMAAMSTRINACLTGAAEATSAYVRGDEDMMTTYQTNAAQAVVSQPPK